jgi:hypothetical protein
MASFVHPLVLSSLSLSSFALRCCGLLIIKPLFHPIAHVFGGMVNLVSAFKDKGFCGTFVDAYTATNALIRLERSYLPFLVCGLG